MEYSLKNLILFIITSIAIMFTAGCAGNSSSATTTLKSITITVENNDIPLGYKTNIKAIGRYTDNTTNDITNNVQWKSANTAIVDFVSGQNATMLSAKSIGSTTITASLNGVTSNILSITTNNAILESIVISTPSNNIPKGVTTQFTASGLFSNGTPLNITDQIMWNSESDAVLSINSAGLATGLSEGTSTISATSLGTNTITSNTINVTVTSAVLTLLQISPNPITIAKDQSKQLTVTGLYSDGSSRDDLADEITWSSTDDNIIDVQHNIATGNNPGTAQVTATIGGISATVSATTTLATLTSISLKTVAQEDKIAKGSVATFIATGTYSDGTTGILLNSRGAWTSSNSDVFNISDGIATAMQGSGTSDIDVAYNGVSSNKVTLTATLGTLTSISLGIESTILKPKFDGQIIATGTFTDGKQDLITQEATWISSDSSIINVDKGHITANESGTATITASYKGIESTLSITVLPVTLESIHIEFVGPFESTIYYGMNTTRVKATGYYNNGESIDITENAIWRNGANKLCTVYTKGENGYAIGTVTQTARSSSNTYTNYLTATWNGVTSNQIVTHIIPGVDSFSEGNIMLSKNPISVQETGYLSVAFIPKGSSIAVTIPPGYLSALGGFTSVNGNLAVNPGQSSYTGQSAGMGQLAYKYWPTALDDNILYINVAVK